MTVRIDVSAFDDTELGAEVRARFAEGRTLVTLFDGTQGDDRAMTWVDGTHGLYRLRCPSGHVWLSHLTGPAGHRGPVQDVCPTCGRYGTWIDALTDA